MQSRFDHLIHKHDAQRNRRPILGGLMAVAAIVAAALFLLTPSTTQAHDPVAGAPPGGANCAGLSTGALDVGALRSEKAVHASPDGNCQVSFVVIPPTGGTATSCQVGYTPTETAEGVEVGFTMAGQCDGVQVDSEVTVSPGSTAYPLASSASSKWALSKLFTHDVVHVIMFLHYSRVDWTYDGSQIRSARRRTFDFTNDWWHIHSTNKRGYMNSTETIYDGSHEGVWHSDGFPTSEAPDVHSKSKVTTRVRAGGSHTCYYSFKWVSGAGNYPNLHRHTLCQYGS